MKEAKELIRMATEISSAAKEEFSASGAVDLNLTVRIWFDEEPGGNLIRRIKATTEKALKRLDRILRMKAILDGDVGVVLPSMATIFRLVNLVVRNRLPEINDLLRHVLRQQHRRPAMGVVPVLLR